MVGVDPVLSAAGKDEEQLIGHMMPMKRVSALACGYHGERATKACRPNARAGPADLRNKCITVSIVGKGDVVDIYEFGPWL